MHHRNVGHTSKSFSIAMKVLVAIEALKGDLDIQDPPTLVVSDTYMEKSCQ